MHRQLVLTAIACLSLVGCARNSATVAGDPFLSPNQDSSKTVVAKAAQPRQTVSLDEHRIDQANFESRSPAATGQVPAIDHPTETIGAEGEVPAVAPPDQAEWWNTPAVVEANAKDGIKVPPSTSVQGRVGHASVSYGMGQISRP